jgi:hypothetical protein
MRDLPPTASSAEARPIPPIFFAIGSLHSPILSKGPQRLVPPDGGRIANLFIASSLVPAMASDAGNPMFDHPNGYQV